MLTLLIGTILLLIIALVLMVILPIASVLAIPVLLDGAVIVAIVKIITRDKKKEVKVKK